MGINCIIYLKENINPKKENLESFNLFNFIKNFQLSEGSIKEINQYTIVIYDTNNFDVAKIKNILSKHLFKVETFVEYHPKLK